MERHDKPSTADIAERDHERVAPDEADLGDELRDEARGRGHTEEDSRPLLEEDASSDVRNRWEGIQVSFVGEPRRAVEEADALVAELMQRLADSFAQERERLEAQWDRGDEVSTEELRVALQRYRSFFNRLLSA